MSSEANSTLDDAELYKIAQDIVDPWWGNEGNPLDLKRVITAALKQIRDARLVGPTKEEQEKARWQYLSGYIKAGDRKCTTSNSWDDGIKWFKDQLRLEPTPTEAEFIKTVKDDFDRMMKELPMKPRSENKTIQNLEQQLKEAQTIILKLQARLEPEPEPQKKRLFDKSLTTIERLQRESAPKMPTWKECCEWADSDPIHRTEHGCVDTAQFYFWLCERLGLGDG
jgi:hypothetical protein